jgi:hypothetical protein
LEVIRRKLLCDLVYWTHIFFGFEKPDDPCGWEIKGLTASTIRSQDVIKVPSEDEE